MENELLTGKTCLVTGGSRGIGFETARGLARLGAHVIIVSHNQERVQAAQKQINQDFGANASRYYVADLSAQKSIQQFVEQIKQDYSQLDILINNVGGWFNKYQPSPDGIEMTFALNHLSYFSLTGHLLPMLEKSDAARIVNVASDAHLQAKGINFDDINFQNRYNTIGVYAHSKLANLLFTYELASRLKESNMTVNALHPGFVKTELFRNFGAFTPVVNGMVSVIGKSPAEGAKTSLYLASAPEVAGVSGQYFSDSKPKRSSPASYDQSQAKRLWALSEEMTGFKYPSIQLDNSAYSTVTDFAKLRG